MSPRHESERFTTVDTAWLNMESPTNLMMIAGFFVFDGPADWDAAEAVLEDRLLRFPRFNRRVAPSGIFRPPTWQRDPGFSLGDHIDRITLPGRGTEAAFRSLVDELVSSPLAMDRPLWQATFIDNYHGRSVAFFRIHHSVADGMALLRVLLSVCDPAPDGDSEGGARSAPGDLPPSASAIRGAAKFAGSALREGLDLLRDPVRALELADTGSAYARAFSKLTLLPPDAATSLRGPLGRVKRAAWTGQIPLPEVKAVARRGHATVNDVLLANVSGALGRYLSAAGENVDRLAIRAMVPVDIRPADVQPELGNRFGLVLPALPIGVPDHDTRLAHVKQEMDAIKRTPEAAVSYAILQTIGATASQVQAMIVDFFAAKSSLVLTNVPGPTAPLWFAGSKIERMMFWVPQAGRLGVGISILSYNGSVGIGVLTDEQLVPDPQAVVEHIHAIHREAAAAAGLRPRRLDSGRPRCTAITLAGDRCRNRARRGAATCGSHRPVERPKTA